MFLTESIIAAVIPMFLYTMIIWKLDKFEPEPLSLVIKSYLSGAIISVVISLIFSYLISDFISRFSFYKINPELIDSVMLAPVIEEISKGFILIFIVNSLKFDNLTDGIVYGSAIGLGFGMTENFLYFFTENSGFYSWIILVMIRSLFSAVMHGVSTASLGAFLALYKFSASKKRFLFPFTGFLIAVVIHMCWNLLVISEVSFLVPGIFMFLIIILYWFIFQHSIKQERKVIYSELLEEELNCVLPEGFASLVSSSSLRTVCKKNKGLIKEIPLLAIQLAFRKHQVRLCSGHRKIYYSEQTNILREKIIQLMRL